MNGAQDQRLRKASFYQELDALQNKDEDDSDPGRRASENTMKKAQKKKKTDALKLAHRLISEAPRSASGSKLAASRVYDKESGPPKLSVFDILKTEIPELRQSLTNNVSIATVPKMHGKRKHESTATTSLGTRKLFDGLQFYFFPNNDVAPARRMRINKAVELGATWRKSWSDTITHVILDKDMTYGGLLKFIKLQGLPDNVTVVQENYPPDCISYRTLLNPRLPQYAVKGHSSSNVKELSGPRTMSVDAGCHLAESQETIKPTVTTTRSNLDPLDQIEEFSYQAQKDVRTPGDENQKEFELALQQARGIQNIPIDDEDESSATSASERPDPGHDDESPDLRLHKKRKTKSQMTQDGFQCMQKHSGEKPDSPNIATIDILQQMVDYYCKVGDEWRTRAYRKVISTLKNHPTRIVTKEDALRLPNIGERLASKIEEIVLTNRLQRLEYARTEPGDKALQTFMRIYGVGVKQASRWVHAGYSTLDELAQKANLSSCQRIGIEHYDDFNSRIPRAEVEDHGNMVRQAVRRVDPSFQVIIGGSYRRGAPTCGDIDCIITRPGADAALLRGVVLDRVVPSLFDAGFLVATLATSTRDDGSKWHGASRLPGTETWRRLDLLLVPWDEMGAALIYFTGNDIFNRSLRLLARKKGMRLNQRGLYRDALRGRSGTKLTEGILVEGKDEKRIFEILGVPWRPPEHRSC